ncbi:sensor histidine kinase [Leptolyngbya boryana]|uniref:sensor histidine kinase n=1 Tax=Leptolyngbya boryana TaxID=1184 RepID=UPI000A3467DD|nr:ATP-binding protein [Leptolyngbya boryana]
MSAPQSSFVAMHLDDSASTTSPKMFTTFLGFPISTTVVLVCQPLNVEIFVDGDRIVQTLINLLGNAIKFSSEGSEVYLKAELVNGDQWVRFQVRDWGRGIPQDKLDLIFERFQQANATDARQHGGTGLGLAISRDLVQLHGGQIWVESTLGEGSTFYFTVPIR